jgi:hypothetical protein
MRFGPNEFSIVMMVVGAFVIASSAADWELFFSNPRSLVSLLGRARARIFWAVVGLGMLGFGAACLAGLIALPPPQ